MPADSQIHVEVIRSAVAAEETAKVCRRPGATLGYWAIRGLGSPLRLLLHYLQVDFVDRRYVQGDYDAEVPYSRDAWLSEKHKLGLDFPNLPYWIENGNDERGRERRVRLTETLPIMRYLCRRYGERAERTDAAKAFRLGVDDAQVDMLANVSMDVRHAMSRCFYSSQNEQQAVHAYQEGIVPKLVLLESYCRRHQVAVRDEQAPPRPFLAGTQVSYVDLFLAETLDQLQACIPNALDAFPHLSQLRSHVWNLERVQQFLASELYIASPANNRVAFLGSSSQLPPPSKLPSLQLPRETVDGAHQAVAQSYRIGEG
ncbi:hypothetical protein CDCA_CDCA12G3442 [Cyanidium caldarium]|uniref:glutathione transferase n=1 Tax=Cyanidium caldarium TaxID=2771 RepID=A0AAV9IYQ3_CYACA|nr:hypothetical protein CDCA_CDCA12G3442 [Cyanidium caldarium]